MQTIDLSAVEKSAINGIRVSLGIAGAVALVVGILILGWPVKTASFVAGVIAAYAAIAGVVNVAIGIFSRRLGAWPRIGHLALGAVFIVVAVVAFANLQAAAAWLATLIGIIVGIAWVIDGIVGLTMLGDSASKVWTVIYAIVSLIAGVVLITSPVWGAALLWLLIGASLVILGIVQIVRAFTFGSRI